MLASGCGSPRLPLGPLDPGQQDRTPQAAVERLDAVGPGTQQHEIAGRAGTPDAKPTRGPHMVEFGPAEAIVRDSQLGEDAALIAGPHLRPHGGWDRVAPAASGPRCEGITAQHLVTPAVGAAAQAAAVLAARMNGCPMTFCAGPWSQPNSRRASRKAATVARSTTTGSRRAPSGRMWRIPKRVAAGTG